jgi:PPM family protein phosphatase
MLQQSLLAWIERPVSGKGTNYESTLPAIIATDIGLVRKENQDRAVAMRFANNGRTQTVFALADGMGGLRDGGHCASLALAGFLTSYATSTDKNTYTRLQASALYANELYRQSLSITIKTCSIRLMLEIAEHLQ